VGHIIGVRGSKRLLGFPNERETRLKGGLFANDNRRIFATGPPRGAPHMDRKLRFGTSRYGSSKYIGTCSEGFPATL
jgi:hypothetical protein